MAGTLSKLPMLTRTWVAVATLLPALLAFAPSAAAKQQPNGMPRVQKHESRHEIDQLEDQWRQAVLKPNLTLLTGLLADDYLAILPSGTLQTKDETLASLRDGHMKFSSIEITDRKVRFYGATALVTSVAVVAGTLGDSTLTGSYRYSRVYVRNAQGAWKVVSFEANKIREPGDRKQ